MHYYVTRKLTKILSEFGNKSCPSNLVIVPVDLLQTVQLSVVPTALNTNINFHKDCTNSL